jgi:DNA-binding NarL/FixJ family response regulator
MIMWRTQQNRILILPYMPTRILLYDDNEALRISMQAMLGDRPELELLAAMPNAETIETDIRVFKPDVVLMDIDMPVTDGIQALKRIRSVNPELPVIMLTVFDDNDNILNAICAGASGYILKRYATEEIPAAIHNVLTGGAPMTGAVARKVLQMVPPAKTAEQERGGLTQKETGILQLLASGHSYKMIAAQTGTGIDTVRFHIKKIYDKLQVHSAREAVSKAMRDKLISIFI